VRRIALPGEPLVNGATALRPWRDSDIPALVELCQDPEISRWTRVPSQYTENDARLYMLHRHDLLHAGASAPFAIVAADAGELLGSVAILRIEWQQLRGEVGYWLGAPARGRGHATRAVQSVCEWAFATLGLERITLLAATGNTPSQRVAELAGFSRELVLRSYARRGPERLDMVCFGLSTGSGS
jgi:RimJ/RimL family protein N-acetyltransferase